MLAYVDQDTKIKVLRIVKDPEGRVTRERLGVVRKKDFCLDEDLERLADADKASIDEMIAFYNESERLAKLASVYALPATLRKIIDYAIADGSAFEREMVMMSLVEALRMLRKSEASREAASSDP